METAVAMTKQMSTIRKFAWAFGILLLFAAAAYISLKIPTPSHWIGAKTEDASEWLGWFGLSALAVAIFQLVKTKNASNAAKEASERAIGAITRFDATTAISSAIEKARRAVDEFEKSDYPAAKNACDGLLDLLAQIKPLHSKLPIDANKTLEEVNLKVTSSRNEAVRGHETPLDESSRQNVITTMQEQKRTLLTLEAELRENHSEL